MIKVDIFEDECVTVKLSGCLDYFTVGIFKDSLEELSELYKSKVIFDCKNLTFIDSSGIGGFIDILREHPKYKVEFINLDRIIENTFELVGFFQIQNTLHNHYEGFA